VADIENGSLTLTQLQPCSVNLSKSGVGTLIVNALQANSLLIASGAVVIAEQPSPAETPVVVVQSLTLAGSSGAWTSLLDLTNNDAIVHDGSLADITNQLAEGFNGVTPWTGTAGIISSTAANDSAGLTALGVATGLTTFDGETVGSTDVLIKYTYYGDANLDGQIDGTDYSMIDTGFGGGGTGWQFGDFNYDGLVDGSDYSLIDNAFNQQAAMGLDKISTATALIDGNGQSVPEPGALSLSIGFVTTSLLARHRREHRRAKPI
jgi:hypothetical protein